MGHFPVAMHWQIQVPKVDSLPTAVLRIHTGASEGRSEVS